MIYKRKQKKKRKIAKSKRKRKKNEEKIIEMFSNDLKKSFLTTCEN